MPEQHGLPELKTFHIRVKGLLETYPRGGSLGREYVVLALCVTDTLIPSSISTSGRARPQSQKPEGCFWRDQLADWVGGNARPYL